MCAHRTRGLGVSCGPGYHGGMRSEHMAYVGLRLPSGTVVRAAHGAIVGRLASCAVQVDDPGISEAHALVSLRAGAFRMLSLRGQLVVNGAVVKEARLAPNVEVQLTPHVAVRVTRVELPRVVLAIEGPGVPRQALATSCAIITRPRPALVPGFHEAAQCWIWSNGIEWMLRISGSPDRPLRDGEQLDIDGVAFSTSLMALDIAGGAVTIAPTLELEPLVITARFDLVHIARSDAAVVTIAGRPARIVSELAAMGGCAPWEVLAAEIWPAESRAKLRKRLDVNLARLRRKLRSHRIRPDLISPRGNGTFELVLHARDSLIEE